jgi:hypothetical protein
VTEALARARVLYPEIAEKAPSVQHWGRRKSDHQAEEERAEKSVAVES